MNYYRRYCGDYLRDTADLTLAEHGAYTILLDFYYSMGHPIPGPMPALHRISRADTELERAAVENVVNRFFPLNGEGLRHNKRADLELGIAAKAIEKMSLAGQRGAAKRWNGAPNRVTMHPPTTILQPPRLKPKSNNKPQKTPFVLPDWIPEKQWEAWIEARTRKRNPPTDFAKKLAVNRLQDLQEQGHSPALVLAESAFNGWAGLFAPKGQK